ncbi:MAG: endonuclease III [Acidobacteria bacterium]|nr:endonuclease III [Acidobacteriota bacterium]
MRKPQQANLASRLAGELAAAYPDATCELAFSNPYELLVATILSAQCTDARVNQVTPALFARFPDAAALAGADTAEVEALIRPTGFFRSKTRSLLGMARALVERHGGSVPAEMDALTALPGVGRKTANVVLGTAFGLASGVVVDTHVARLARRLGLSRSADPAAIEADLMVLFPPEQWVALAHRLILHGRRVCAARKPACDRCTLSADCPKHGV